MLIQENRLLSKRYLLPAGLVVIIFALSFRLHMSKNTMPTACMGHISKINLTPSGAIRLDGQITLQFTGQDEGRSQLNGWLIDSQQTRFRINRLVEFEINPETESNLFLSKVSNIEKSPDDNVPDDIFKKFSLLSRSHTYLGIYRLSANTIAVADNGIPFLVCSAQDVP